MSYLRFKKIFITLFQAFNLLIILYIWNIFLRLDGRLDILEIIILSFILLINYFLYKLLIKTKYAGIITIISFNSVILLYLKHLIY